MFARRLDEDAIYKFCCRRMFDDIRSYRAVFDNGKVYAVQEDGTPGMHGITQCPHCNSQLMIELTRVK